jgi:Amino acid permease
MSTTNVRPSSEFDVVLMPDDNQRKVNLVLVSSVALAFISFWRAAAIVLCDLASTAYYIGGISEPAIGKAAPWFILGVMLFSYAVRAVYVESCTMFTRGGVYKVVKEAMGGSLAKLSVSALMFDYILTGPISAVSAGQYMVGLGVDLLNLVGARHGRGPIDPTQYKNIVNLITVLLAIGITIYFWRTNIIGIHESSDKALRIMQLTTVMGILIIGWSAFTLALHPERLHLPPFHPVFTSDSAAGREGSLGWLVHFPRIIGALGIIIAFGHSLLAMSGEESLAQVNREIEAPKLKNLLRAGFVIFIYSLLLTSVISFLAVLIIPDGKRVATMIVPNGAKPTESSVVKVDYLRKDAATGKEFGFKLDDSAQQPVVDYSAKMFVTPGLTHIERDDGGYRDNLINGLVQYLSGPSWLKIVMEIFVVLVGFLILAGAVNTSIVGSNGVLNRLAEDGVLTPWFLHPQTKFGTTHRLINLVTILQLITIVASWGDVNTLGEAYAFGVIWSFVFKTLAMVVLRFKDKSPRQYEVPLNIRVPIKPKLADPLQRVCVPQTPADGVSPKPDLSTCATHIDLPIGITIIFLILFCTAMVNLVTKKTATIWGLGFTAAFLIAFITLEKISHRRRGGGHHAHLEQFNETVTEAPTPESSGLLHPNPVLVAVRNPNSMKTLGRLLREINTERQDIVAITCKVLPPLTPGITPAEMRIDDIDREVLTRVVTIAEESGKRIHPLVIPTNNPLYAIATAARTLGAGEVVLGVSEKSNAEFQAEQFAMAWGMALAEQPGERPLLLRILGPSSDLKFDL